MCSQDIRQVLSFSEKKLIYKEMCGVEQSKNKECKKKS